MAMLLVRAVGERAGPVSQIIGSANCAPGRATDFMDFGPAPVPAGYLCRSRVDAPRSGTAPRSVRLANLASPARFPYPGCSSVGVWPHAEALGSEGPKSPPLPVEGWLQAAAARGAGLGRRSHFRAPRWPPGFGWPSGSFAGSTSNEP